MVYLPKQLFLSRRLGRLLHHGVAIQAGCGGEIAHDNHAPGGRR
jgi:hypothetical protein